MSIELKQAAQQALSALEKSQPHPSNPVIGLTNQDFIDHEETIRQLRAAIQQAEAKTGGPVGYMNAGQLYELQQGRAPYGYIYPQCGAGASVEIFTHPAPGVPDGWSDRHTRVAAFALRRFADAAWERSDEAAQKSYMGNPSDYKAFQSDAKDAEEARAILLTTTQAQKGQP